MSIKVLVAGAVGLLLAASLWITVRDFDLVFIGRLAAMATLILFSASGHRWASWILATWFSLLMIAVAVGGARAGGFIGIALGFVQGMLFVSMAWLIVRTTASHHADRSTAA